MGNHDHSSNDRSNASSGSVDYSARAEQEVSKIAFDGGKLFGVIPVPKNFEGVARGIQTSLSHFLTHDLEKRVGEMVPAQYKAGATRAVRWGVPLLLESVPLIKCGIHWHKDMSAFNDRLKPFFAANHADQTGMAGLFASEEPNAIITVARNNRHRVHTNSMLSIGVSAGINSLYVGAKLEPKIQKMFDNVNNNKVVAGITEGMEKPATASVGGAISGGTVADIVVGFAGDSLRNMISEKLPAKLKGKCALDLCEEFVKATEGAVKNIDPLDDYEVDKACKNAQRSVMAIFERRFEEQPTWAPMSERVREDLETLTMAMVRPIIKGELSPWAILNLAGQNKILQNDGAAVANEDELKAALDEQMKKFAVEKMESLKEYYGKVSFRAQDVAHAIKTFGDEEKAFLSVLLNDKVMLDAGATKEQLEQWRASGNKMMESRGAEIIMMLAEQPVKELHEHFSKQEIDLIQKLGANLKRLDHQANGHDEHATKALGERDELLNNKTVRRILANAYVKEASSWEKRIAEKRNVEKEAREAGVEDEGIRGP